MSEHEQLNEKLFCDHFESHWCVACGDHGALYAIPPGTLIGACSRCLVRRIESLREAGWDLPPWVGVLEQEARRELVHQEKVESAEFELRFDDFYKCSRCDKLIHQSDARYPTQAKDRFGGISPHCLDCYTIVSADS